MRKSRPSSLVRIMSRLVAAYPFQRGQTRLRRISEAWLVGRLPFGPWVRVSGTVCAEWDFLFSHPKEIGTTEFVKSFLRPGMTFVDVGANVGYFTLLAASVGTRVIAYEPTPAVVTRLRENIELNAFDAVTVVNAAVTDRQGTIGFHESPDDPEANSIFGKGGDLIEVSAVTLDEDLAGRGIQKVDLLKVDVEGAELSVLVGAAKVLSSAARPTIILELNPATLRDADSDSAAIIGWLHASGYQTRNLEVFNYQGETVVNLLATPVFS
jgi:FkbM family methyltransferase